MASNIPKIVIIGAGAAGIAAATRLLENGMNDLIVLEAENRIGGRIHSVEFDGSTVDLGGQWCHGQKGNIVYDLVKDLDLLSSSHNNYTDFSFYSSDGSVVDRSVTDRLLEILDEVADDEEAARKAKGTYGDYVTNEYRKRVSRLFGDNEQIRHMSEPLLNWFHKLMINLDPADSWFELSSAGPFYYKECEGDLYLQWRNKGFKTILDVLMKKVPDITKQLPLDGKIFLNKEVNRILWDSKIVNGGGVTVDCSDGSSYNCDHVIITVSLGVLKNLSKTFIPELPFAKQKAIEVMAIGNVKKILLKFPTQWWPDHVKGFSLIWNEEDRKNLVDEFPYGPCEDGRSWLEDVFGFYVVDSHPKILLCWVVGKMIERIEQLSDDVVVDGCIFLLKKFLGQKYNISQPDAVLRSKWKTNPHFNGCYTYQCLEADKVNISARDLASPVVNSSGRQVLLFAGEATHANYFSTVHGAIETGYREAERISKIYKSAVKN